MKWIGKVAGSVTSGIGKLWGSKENREKFKAKASERLDVRNMKELVYRQSKLAPGLYTFMAAPLGIMWAIVLYSPILLAFPWIWLKDIIDGYMDLVDKFGMEALALIILRFLGVSGVKVFQGFNLKKFTKELEAHNRLEEKDRALNFNVQKLIEWEGNRTNGYVPKGNIGKKSGVTIGMGVDLGYQSIERYQRAMLPKGIIDKISPYIGVIGGPARELLQKVPLKLSDSEASKITEVTLKIYAKEVRKHFNGTLYTYPEEAQTVILSRAWHGGTNLPKKAPKFYKAAIEKDWKAMENELRNYYRRDANGKMDHQWRLNEEADFIARVA